CLLAQHWHKNRPRLAPAPALRLVEINWYYRANARDCKFRKNRLFIRLQGQVCREQDRGSVTQDFGDSYAQRGKAQSVGQLMPRGSTPLDLRRFKPDLRCRTVTVTARRGRPAASLMLPQN